MKKGTAVHRQGTWPRHVLNARRAEKKVKGLKIFCVRSLHVNAWRDLEKGNSLASDLPPDRDAFLLRAMGSPDARRIDGKGVLARCYPMWPRWV